MQNKKYYKKENLKFILGVAFSSSFVVELRTSVCLEKKKKKENKRKGKTLKKI